MMLNKSVHNLQLISEDRYISQIYNIQDLKLVVFNTSMALENEINNKNLKLFIDHQVHGNSYGVSQLFQHGIAFDVELFEQTLGLVLLNICSMSTEKS